MDQDDFPQAAARPRPARALFAWLGGMLFGAKGEHPSRLDKFMQQLKSIEWQKADDVAKSLDTVSQCLNALLQHEVLYYFKIRTRKRKVSDLTRFLSYVAGSIGFLMPFIASAHRDYAALGPWGYFFLALAAALLGANRLFGSTAGHIRNATAQYQLEKTMTIFRLDWECWRAKLGEAKAQEADIEEAFKLLKQFAADSYFVIEAETRQWGESALEALMQFEAQVNAGRGPK
jgi:hypothetical protein